MSFGGLIAVPFAIYRGNMSIAQGAVAIVQQGIWIGVFILIGRWMVSRGMRRLVVQGG